MATKEFTIVRCDVYNESQPYHDDEVISLVKEKIAGNIPVSVVNVELAKTTFGQVPEWTLLLETIKENLEPVILDLYRRNPKTEIVLVSRAPLSAFTEIGFHFSREQIIATKLGPNWDLHYRLGGQRTLYHNPDEGRSLQLKLVDKYELPEKCHSYALLFISLNPLFKLCEQDISDIKTSLPEGRFVDRYYELKPPGNTSIVLKGGDEENCFSKMCDDIQSAYNQIFETRYAECRTGGFIIITTGPLPLAHVAGVNYKVNLYGTPLFGERISGKYHLFPSHVTD